MVSSILEHTTEHGAVKGKTQNVKVKYYNIDAVLSVGYRVNSIRATQFRIWATRVLKDYLLKGYAINNRMNRLEDNLENLKSKVEQIDLQISTHLIPNQGVFFDGQVFDAYELASKIIRTATKNMVLIDNFINENALIHLAKKNKGVTMLLLTKNISKQLNLDVQKDRFISHLILMSHLMILKNICNPFDRLIISQAMTDNLTIITKDEYIEKYDIKTIW